MNEIFESYDGTVQPPEEPRYFLEHADHCIEAQHHDENEYYPRRIPEKFEAIEGFFPKQDVMLLNVESKTKKSLTIEFSYSNNLKISRVISELDLVRVFFIDSNNSNNLTEKIGKIFNINYQYNYIEIDCSGNYGRKEFRIPVQSMRFISNDLDEVPPFISKEKESISWKKYDYQLYVSKVLNDDKEVFEPIIYTKPIIQ